MPKKFIIRCTKAIDNKEEKEEYDSIQFLEDMKTIEWLSKNAKFMDFSAAAEMARSNESHTETKSDTEDEEEEKTYKCSDCDTWVKPSESCCGSDEEEDEEEEGDWWIAHNGNIEFITSTLTKVENMGADEWGLIRSFTDNREKE